jgi:hypothetical protein
MQLRVCHAITKTPLCTTLRKSGRYGGWVAAHALEDDALENLRVAVYRRFATRGALGSTEELAAAAGLSVSETETGLRALAEERLDEAGSVVMAHPFAAIPLGFSVMGSRTLWWGGCAWDSFALPHLLTDEPDVLVATRCPNCDTPHSWVVNRERPPAGEQVAHFLTPVAKIWDDVVHSCAHQRLFCGASCIDNWLESTGNARGYVMDLATLWRLGSRWYAGRLDVGYRRREPSMAADYFREVGLHDAFWGLPD